MVKFLLARTCIPSLEMDICYNQNVQSLRASPMTTTSALTRAMRHPTGTVSTAGTQTITRPRMLDFTRPTTPSGRSTIFTSTSTTLQTRLLRIPTFTGINTGPRASAWHPCWCCPLHLPSAWRLCPPAWRLCPPLHLRSLRLQLMPHNINFIRIPHEAIMWEFVHKWRLRLGKREEDTAMTKIIKNETESCTIATDEYFRIGIRTRTKVCTAFFLCCYDGSCDRG